MTPGGGCDERNPLVRDGAAQGLRRPRALHPRWARVDERSLADLLLLLGRYAERIQYWDSSGRPDGDFASFIRRDPSFLVAEIAAHDHAALRRYWDRARQLLKEKALPAIDGSGAFNLLFRLIFNEIVTLNRWLRTAQPGLVVHGELLRQVTGALRPPLASAMALYRRSVDDGLLTATRAVSPQLCSDACLAADAFLTVELEGVWLSPDAPDQRFADALAAADGSSVDLGTGDPLSRVRSAGSLLDPVFETLSRALAQLGDGAPGWLHQSLTEHADHPPQMALTLGVLRLYRFLQAQLNDNSRRHLDFYYERVLRLGRRRAIGDRVNLCFTLAKKSATHLLPEGTLLRGGKDVEGNELLYRLTADAALNRASLAEPTDLRCVHFDKDDGYRPCAALVAASADGQGAAFADGTEPKWSAFGQSQRRGAGFLPVAERTMAFAELGFAIASPELFLREGTRRLDLWLSPTIEQSGAGLAAEQLRIRFTGDKGWEELDVAAVAVAPEGSDEPALLAPANLDGDPGLRLYLELAPDVPPFSGYDPEVHGPGYSAPYPVLEVRLRSDESVNEFAYARLRAVDLSKLVLNVHVEGLQSLVLQNDAGLLNPAKPFAPFGAVPKPGSSLYLGSGEVFRKRLTQLTLHFRWQSPPASTLSAHYACYANPTSFANSAYRATWSVLAGRTWHDSGGELGLFDGVDAAAQRDVSLPFEGLGLPDEREGRFVEPAPQAYRTTSEWGFLRLSLATASSDPFGHVEYPGLYAQKALLYAKEGSGLPSLPLAPWTPVMESLSLDYRSRVELDLGAAPRGADRFWHIHAFGPREASVEQETAAAAPLLPRYLHDESDDGYSRGELYLGLSGLAPRQTVSLLVQVAEGSADPEVPQPEVRWWYFGPGGFVAFAPQQILRDDTGGLIRSGILVFDIPADASVSPGFLPSGRHWLRATVAGDPKGVCQLLAIRAQAATAELVDPADHAAHLSLPLPAGSVGALLDKRSAIKAVEQPYASRAGRAPERVTAYRTRVAERLRHKDRAIAMWDYERLVLEAFPALYKVKCINHSTYLYEDESLAIAQSEFAPGWVSVVVIPDLQNQNAVDPLSPRASLAVLDEVKRFLAARMSPWAAARLRVLNPLYERITVDCKVDFVAGADRAIYEAKLIEDLKRYLSPWAFPEEGGADLSFGGSLHRSTLLHFVEKRPYVDFVTDFRMLHRVADGPADPVERAVPSSSRSVFASAATHVLAEAEC